MTSFLYLQPDLQFRPLKGYRDLNHCENKPFRLNSFIGYMRNL